MTRRQHKNIRPEYLVAIVITLMVIAAFAFVVLYKRNSPAAKSNTTAAKQTSSQTVMPPPAAPAPVASPSPTPQINPNRDAILNSFSNKYGYPILGISICPHISNGEYVDDLANLDDAVNNYLPEQETLSDYFNSLFTACSDNKLSFSEYAQVVTALERVANTEGNLLRWHTHMEFENEMGSYLSDTLGETAPNCAVINTMTADAFMTHVNKVISGYSLTLNASDLRQEFTSRQTACAPQPPASAN